MKKFPLAMVLLLTCFALSQAPHKAAKAAAHAASATPRPSSAFITYTQARPELEHFTSTLPQQLQGKRPAQLAALWPRWVRQQDAAVRARLAQGDIDSVVNLLSYGTSFTHQPRLTIEFFEDLDKTFQQQGPQAGQAKFNAAAGGRLNDLMAALQSSDDERIAFARQVLKRNGYGWTTSAEQQRARAFLAVNLKRVRDDYDDYARQMQAARATGDPEQEMQVRSQLFEKRGISLDTSWLPNLALQNALRELRDSGALKHVDRVAIVGPGLDYVDKSDGYDLYPVQTLQPFAVAESLLALGMSSKAELQITTFDISDRVNSHITHARAAAEAGKPYDLHLLLDPSLPWESATLDYWQKFGANIGSRQPEQDLGLEGKKLRLASVEVPAAEVLHLHPADLNIIYARQPLPQGKKFDLIIGTNIFVYYSGFEQSLAEDNAAAMLREGGLLLSNDFLPELPATGLAPLRTAATRYSTISETNGDEVFCYIKRASPGRDHAAAHATVNAPSRKR